MTSNLFSRTQKIRGARGKRNETIGDETTMASDDLRLILLWPDDNVLVARSRIRAGETFSVGGAEMIALTDVPLGHKLARRAIKAGEKILKYGAPIGSATMDIALGAHVHVHNIKSDYTPTHHLYDARAKHGEQP